MIKGIVELESHKRNYISYLHVPMNDPPNWLMVRAGHPQDINVTMKYLVFGLMSVLWPFNTVSEISNAVSYPNHTVSGQAS